MNGVFSKLDWSLLRKQKAELQKVGEEARTNGSTQRSDCMDGLVCMIDEIQDNAVAAEGQNEKEVFG